MNPLDVKINAIYDRLADLAEAHREYVGGCLDEEEYQLVCAQADELNQELELLNDLRKMLAED